MRALDEPLDPAVPEAPLHSPTNPAAEATLNCCCPSQAHETWLPHTAPPGQAPPTHGHSRNTATPPTDLQPGCGLTRSLGAAAQTKPASQADAGLPKHWAVAATLAPVAPSSSERLTSVLFLESTLESIRQGHVKQGEVQNFYMADLDTEGSSRSARGTPAQPPRPGCLQATKEGHPGQARQLGPQSRPGSQGPLLAHPDGLPGLKTRAGRGGRAGTTAAICFLAAPILYAATLPDHSGRDHSAEEQKHPAPELRQDAP